MTNNVSVQYNGGLLPDIILLTKCYYHRGTRSNAMKKFVFASYNPPKRFDISPLTEGCSEGLDAFRCFFERDTYSQCSHLNLFTNNWKV